MKKSKCKLIAIEGADQQGKSTQSVLLSKVLAGCGYKVYHVKAPVYFDVVTFRVIYWMIKRGHATNFPTLFQSVQFLNKKLFSTFILPFITRKADFVVFDRWTLSSLVYGTITKANERWLKFFDNSIRQPDLNVILYGTTKSRGSEDPLEAAVDIQTAVQTCYLEITENIRNQCVVVSSDDTVENVASDIFRMLSYKKMLR